MINNDNLTVQISPTPQIIHTSSTFIEIASQVVSNLIAKYYNVLIEHQEKQNYHKIWYDLQKCLQMPQSCVINMLYTNEQLIFFILEKLMQLPFTNNSKKIINVITEHYDPSLQFLKKLISILVPSLQTSQPTMNCLNVCLTTLNALFSQQTPTNDNLDTYIGVYGGQGLSISQPVRYPFERGGTITLWYFLHQSTKQCKLFEIINNEKVGFQVVIRNKKIYFQRLIEQHRFRLIKNRSTYLCQAITGIRVKLCIDFEIKKRFFQPYFCINVIMNNFAINNVQVDTLTFNSNEFNICMFKNHFYGKIFSVLILTSNLAKQFDELNNNQGFMYENDIRNFTYIFENELHYIYLLYSAIRAKTSFQDKIISTTQKKNYHIQSPKQTQLFDAINRYNAKIGPEANLYRNMSIRKQMINYGGLASLLPFLDLLRTSCSAQDELYSSALREFITLIRNIFQNKTESIEQAYNLDFFSVLSQFFRETCLIGFDEQIISLLKEIYVSLNTRMMRENFIEYLVWKIPAGRYLSLALLKIFIKFIQSFYNEDIQSSLNIFGINSIANFMLQELDNKNCCYNHIKNHQNLNQIKNYNEILQQYYSIMQNIFLVKRNDTTDIGLMIQDIIMMFTQFNASSCFIESLINFLSELFAKDNLLEQYFIDIMQSHSCKMTIFTLLSHSLSWCTKCKLIELVLHLYGLNMVKDSTVPQKHMMALCIKNRKTTIRASSITSQDNTQHSIDFSEDKISFNSINMKAFITIEPLEAADKLLLDDLQIIQMISEWSLSQQVLQLLNDECQNPGLSILMQLYKSSTYLIRKNILGLMLHNLNIIRFSPDLMAWLLQCLLICQYDKQKVQQKNTIINEVKQNLLQLICLYKIDHDLNQNQLSIIKLIIVSVSSKYSSEINKYSNKIFLIVSDQMINVSIIKLNELKDNNYNEIEFNKLCQKTMSYIRTCLGDYFTGRNEDQNQFEEQYFEMLEQQSNIMLIVLNKMFDLLMISSAPFYKLLDEGNILRNQYMMGLLFPEKEGEISIICLIFVVLITLFDDFQDLNIQRRKQNLILVKKYLIFMIELSQNSGSLKIDQYQKELRDIFLNALGFLENKFYQYFYYAFDKHKNLEFTIENRIRKNIEQLKKTILIIFVDLIQLMKYIDQIGSMQHKSFYELMKPKRKLINKNTLKNLYPPWWKTVDQRIIQFMSLNHINIIDQAKQKLQSYIIHKKISLYSSTIEKQISKKIQNFIQKNKKNVQGKKKNSVFIYMQNETEKCRQLVQYEQQIAVLKYENYQRGRKKQIKKNILENKKKRQIKMKLKNLWNQNRVYQGFWKSANFYNFSQNNVGFQYNNQLQQYYERVRLQKRSQFSLMPFIQIYAKPINQLQNIQETEEVYIENQPKQPQLKVQEPSKSEKYLRIGLQFIKKKVIEKIKKSSLLHWETQKLQDKTSLGELFHSILWVKPMKVFYGNIRINSQILLFSYQRPIKSIEHISLFKTKQNSDHLLQQKWRIEDIESYQLRKFMLKSTAVEIFMKHGQSIFFSFNDKSQENFHRFIDLLIKFKKIEGNQSIISLPLRLLNSWKIIDKFYLTEKWKNYEISNLQYLMILNLLSNRTSCDLNQYFVFPWIMAQYNCTKFKKNQFKYRKMEKNMGTLGSNQRTNKFIQIQSNLELNHKQQFPQSHHFGFHYSNLAIVLQYLIRINPYTEGAKKLQGDKFDLPDRLFCSISDNFKNATSEMSDLRQLIPEFFYFPEFLINCNDLDFGVLQNNQKVNHVQLPNGFQNAYQFIEYHRQNLQSEELSQTLHLWIDLIFGYKQNGKQAQKSINKFHYLSYESSLQYLEQGKQELESLQSQIAFYGKIPTQLFTKPHPKRNLQNHSKPIAVKYSRAMPYVNENTIQQNINLKMIRHISGYFAYKNEDPILLSYSNTNKRFITMRRDGKGIIFSLDKSELQISSSKQQIPQKILSIHVINNFEIFIDKCQNIYIFDQKIQLFKIPIISLWCQQIIIGGLWDGKILKYDIINNKIQIINSKHSDTIIILIGSQILYRIVSGSINGQIVIWQFICKDKYNQTLQSNINNSNCTKLQYRSKIALHSSQINCLIINDDLRVVVSASNDCTVGIIDIYSYQILRILRLDFPIGKALLVNYPFYMLYIQCCNNKQYCYSLNGQLLQQCAFEKLSSLSMVFPYDNFKQKIFLKQIGSNCIICLKLPDMTIQHSIPIKLEDQNIQQLLINNQNRTLEILFNTKKFMVYCSQYIQSNH